MTGRESPMEGTEIMLGIAAGLAIGAGVAMWRELGKWRTTTHDAMRVARGYQAAFEDLSEEHAKFVMGVFEVDPDFVLNWDGKTKVFVREGLIEYEPGPGDPPWINHFEI